MKKLNIQHQAPPPMVVNNVEDEKSTIVRHVPSIHCNFHHLSIKVGGFDLIETESPNLMGKMETYIEVVRRQKELALCRIT